MSDELNRARERAKRLIRELQNRTTERGFTEAEALEAAAKLGALLEEHNLNIDEVGVKEEAAKCEKNVIFAADEAAGSMVTAIGKYCELIAYRELGAGTKYVLFGTPHDLEIGVYLYEMLSESIERAWSDYMESYGYSMKKRLSFRAGFANRVYSRLMEMKEERDARNRAQTGTSLMVLKNQLVTEEFTKQLGIKLVKSRGGTVADSSAYYAGQRAGDRANLNNPLGNPSSSASRLR